jgi:hypothetical protein
VFLSSYSSTNAFLAELNGADDLFGLKDAEAQRKFWIANEPSVKKILGECGDDHQ